MKLFQNTVLAIALLTSHTLLANPATTYVKAAFSLGFGTTSVLYTTLSQKNAYRYNQIMLEPGLINQIPLQIFRAPLRCAMLPAIAGHHAAEWVFLTPAERTKIKDIPKQPEERASNTPPYEPIFAALL